MKRGALCARAISSGGERFLDAEEVSGSNPLSPTTKKRFFAGKMWSRSRSSGRGLGSLCSNRASKQFHYDAAYYPQLCVGEFSNRVLLSAIG
jgi:hypothetical protein